MLTLTLTLSLLQENPPGWGQRTPFQGEDIASQRLVRAWQAAGVSGLPPATMPVFRMSDRFGTATVRFGEVTVSWFKETGVVNTIQANSPIYPAHSNVPNLSEAAIRQKASAAISELIASRFTYRIVEVTHEEWNRNSKIKFESLLRGIPIGSAPAGLITLDSRSAQIIQYQAFDIVAEIPDVRIDQALPLPTLLACAERYYLETDPLPVCEVKEYGLRLIRPMGPSLPIPAGLRAVSRGNPQYRNSRAELALSVSFGWQNVLVDALDGRLIAVFGWDSAPRGQAQPQPDIAKLTWKAPKGKQFHKLKAISMKPIKTGKRILLRSKTGSALVGLYEGGRLIVGDQVFSVSERLAADLSKK